MTDSQAVVDMVARQSTRSPLEVALDAFACGDGSSAHMAVVARECSLPVVQIHVRRSKPPAAKQIRLFPGGPLSAAGRSVWHVSGPRWGGVYAAWWRTEDLRLASKDHDHEAVE